MILGCVGNDNYGQRLTKTLDEAKVKTLLEVRTDQKTSLCGVAVFKKERCLLPLIRASTFLSQEFVNQHIDEITKAHLLVIEGYFVIEKFDILKDLVSKFKSLKKEITFTLSATFMVENFYDRLLEISNSSNLIFCNNEEAELFSKVKGEDYEEISRSIHKLLTPLDRTLVITCGKNPTFISKWNYQTEQFDFILKSFVTHIHGDEMVDTNGAGDAFVGGFLSQYIQGKPFEDCARTGNWAAGVIIRNVGCTYPEN